MFSVHAICLFYLDNYSSYFLNEWYFYAQTSHLDGIFVQTRIAKLGYRYTLYLKFGKLIYEVLKLNKVSFKKTSVPLMHTQQLPY